jgi:adenosylhomocysteine nucleosidase
MNRIAIIAAMPGELKPLVRGWSHTHASGVDLWRWSYRNQFEEPCEWIAACAGAGVDAAARAFAAAEACGPVDCVISTGWVGALGDDYQPGKAYWVAGAIDLRTGERFASEEPSNLWLVTSPRVADAAEKQRLATAYGAALVDMEAAAVARLAAMRGLPFLCLKGVSDGFRERLPDLNRFLSPDGRFRLAHFVLFALFRPWCWPALRRMGENSTKAAQAIRASLLANLDPSGELRNRNGYPSR